MSFEVGQSSTSSLARFAFKVKTLDIGELEGLVCSALLCMEDSGFLLDACA